MAQDLRTFLSEVIKAYPSDFVTVEKEVDPKSVLQLTSRNLKIRN